MRALVATALAALLVACAGPRPDPPDEAKVLPPTNWRDAPSTVDVDVDATWWARFADDGLSACIERALAGNDDVAIASTRVEAARARFRLAGGARLPAVSGAIAGGRSRSVSPFLQPALQASGEAELDISFDLDLFGRLRAASDAARAALLGSRAAQANVRLAVVATAARGYLMLRALDARLVVLRDTLKAREASLRFAQRRADTGYATTLDLAQARSEYYATSQQIPVVELAIAQQENGLAVLLGAVPGPIERGRDLDAIRIPDAPVVLPSDLLRRRPDVAAAEQQIVEADHTLDAARAAFMPDLRLSATGGLAASTLLADPIRVFSIGGSILVPLFEGGRLHAQADLAAARRDEAAFAYRKTAITAFQEVENAMVAVRKDAEEEQQLLSQRDALAETLRIAHNRYRAGYSNYLEELDAQRALLSADLALTQVRAARLNAVVSLYQSIGGGWSSDDLASGCARLPLATTPC